MNQQPTARTDQYSQIKDENNIKQYCCKNCEKSIDEIDASVDFLCDNNETHSYHVSCLQRQIVKQIESDTHFIKCSCGMKFHSSVIRDPKLGFETEQIQHLLHKYFTNQLQFVTIRSRHPYQKGYKIYLLQECANSYQHLDFIVPLFKQLNEEYK